MQSSRPPVVFVVFGTCDGNIRLGIIPLAPQVHMALMRHRWPGNVRELKNAAERYVLFSTNAGERLLRSLSRQEESESSSDTTLAEQVRLFERQIIKDSLKRQKGNMKAVMGELDLPRRTLMLFGVGISLGTALLSAKAATWLANMIVAVTGIHGMPALAILAVLAAFLIIIHLGFASATALASAMIPIVIAVLQGVQTPGMNVLGMTMILQFVISFGFILPVNAPQNMVAYSMETFEVKDFIKTGIPLTIIAYLVILLMAATYWKWLGYV
jgi:hypothetical protein